MRKQGAPSAAGNHNAGALDRQQISILNTNSPGTFAVLDHQVGNGNAVYSPEPPFGRLLPKRFYNRLEMIFYDMGTRLF